MGLPTHDASKICGVGATGPGVQRFLSSGGLDLVDHPGVTSNDQLDRTTTDLAVFDRRIPTGRGVHKRGENSSTVRADHLDIFFEVHMHEFRPKRQPEPL
jgi:hypothetical protein